MPRAVADAMLCGGGDVAPGGGRCAGSRVTRNPMYTFRTLDPPKLCRLDSRYLVCLLKLLRLAVGTPFRERSVRGWVPGWWRLGWVQSLDEP